MERRILSRIFVDKLGLGKFIFSGIAFISGLTLVLLSMQTYFKMREHLAPSSAKSDYVILSKEVVMAHTLLGGRAEFTTDEITDLRRQPFVDDLARFKSNHFEVVAQAGGDMGLVTELFFESVPAKFIDNDPPGFSWKEGSDYLPVIVSQDFLDLYNFGFATGRGTRQLSRSTIQLVPIQISVEGPVGRKLFNAKVVGFTERIPSVLVPENFLAWANEHIGGVRDQPASRLIVKVKAGGSAGFLRYTEAHGLVAGAEKLRFGKVLSALDIFMTVTLIVGGGFISFALVIITLNFSLIVSQAKEEVSLLLQLGYTDKQITRHLTGYLFRFMIATVVISMGLWWSGNHWMVALLSGSGIDVTEGIVSLVWILGMAFVIVFVAISMMAIGRLIRKV